MRHTRRAFLRQSALLAGAGLFGPRLLAAMKYDKNAVLDLFRLRASDTDARVKAGIEANRKSPLLVTFRGPNGKICENVHVQVRQTAHAFKYGADLFMLDEIGDDPAKNEAYKDLFAGAFNLATCPFYWSDLEPEQGKPRFAKDSPKIYRRPPPDLCVEWCEAHGIEPKAHCLNYPAFEPAWAKGSIDLEKHLLEKRFRELAERYAARIPMWEVTNETLWGSQWRKSNFYQEEDYVEWSFKTAEKYFGANKLVINEAHCRIWDDNWFHRSRSPYYMQVERAILKGARVDSVGMQFHMFNPAKNVVSATRRFYDPQRLFDVMDTSAALGRPIQITEITIPAYSNDPGDEEVQAEILRELYRIWFSHRAMEAIIYWNLPDGYAAFSEAGDFSKGENAYYGGLCRFDLTPKPAYQVVKDLFGKEWRTDFTRDVPGRFAFRGFNGSYEIVATSNGRTARQTFDLGPSYASTLEVKFA